MVPEFPQAAFPMAKYGTTVPVLSSQSTLGGATLKVSPVLATKTASVDFFGFLHHSDGTQWHQLQVALFESFASKGTSSFGTNANRAIFQLIGLGSIQRAA